MGERESTNEADDLEQDEEGLAEVVESPDARVESRIVPDARDEVARPDAVDGRGRELAHAVAASQDREVSVVAAEEPASEDVLTAEVE